MAHDKATSPLMNLPLEVRHNIFKYAAVRETRPKELLRYWFEKKEVKELVAKEVSDNPTGPAPRVVYHQEHEVGSDTPEEEDEDDEENANDEDEENGEDNEDEDDEIEQEQEDQEAGDGAEGEEEEANENDEPTHAQSTLQTSTSAPGAALPPQSSTTTQTHTQLGSADEQEDEDDADMDAQDGETATEDPQDAGGDEVMAEGDGADSENDEVDAEEGADTDGNGNTNEAAAPATAQQPPPPPAPVVSPARKWRHVPNFMRITHCPPPVELLLVSKQLNEEAKNWFYNVAVLKVNATGSFAHTSFFEETFRQITDAAFSPMENVRKVAVLFAWDTTWLRADDTGCAEAIFPALLRQRSDFVYRILSQAPDLKEVTIHWHDSAQDNESANFMLDILAPFHSLNVHLAIKEHYIATDAKPHKRSIAGQRRVEFQSIMDAGLDRLF